MIMDAKTFFNMVDRMRKAQRNYFRTRMNIYLSQSKELEKYVDDEIERVNKMEQAKKEPRLF